LLAFGGSSFECSVFFADGGRKKNFFTLPVSIFMNLIPAVARKQKMRRKASSRRAAESCQCQDCKGRQDSKGHQQSRGRNASRQKWNIESFWLKLYARAQEAGQGNMLILPIFVVGTRHVEGKPYI
jgi:hypothetical protein